MFNRDFELPFTQEYWESALDGVRRIERESQARCIALSTLPDGSRVTAHFRQPLTDFFRAKELDRKLSNALFDVQSQSVMPGGPFPSSLREEGPASRLLLGSLSSARGVIVGDARFVEQFLKPEIEELWLFAEAAYDVSRGMNSLRRLHEVVNSNIRWASHGRNMPQVANAAVLLARKATEAFSLLGHGASLPDDARSIADTISEHASRADVRKLALNLRPTFHFLWDWVNKGEQEYRGRYLDVAHRIAQNYDEILLDLYGRNIGISDRVTAEALTMLGRAEMLNLDGGVLRFDAPRFLQQVEDAAARTPVIARPNQLQRAREQEEAQDGFYL